MRDRLKEAIKDAMRAKDSVRLSTLRLMSAALKDQDIEKRSVDEPNGLSEPEIVQLFAKMVKQRDDSITAYENAGRVELSQRERDEQQVIREFLPKPLSDTEMQAAIAKAIEDTGAESIRDMGKVMGILKGAYAGRMDFGAAGSQIKASLG